jgi:membrane protease YdiL (CAAX protease family)
MSWSSLWDVFWNDRERRLRAPWRVVLGLLLVLVLGVAGSVLGSALERAGVGPGPPTGGAGVVAQVAVLAGFVAGLCLAGRYVDRRRLHDFGLGQSRAWWADLCFGLALGVAMPGVVFGLELAAGLVQVTGTLVTRSGPTLPATSGVPFALAFAVTAAYFVAVGVFEELFFRGYLLTNVAEGLRGWRLGTRGALAVATVLTSGLFGLAHTANPNASVLAAVTITLYGGFLAAGYLLTGRIATPIGVHVTWNLAVSSVFGFPVSGIRTPVTVVAVEQTGPAVVTGGEFGPEGGLVSLVALAAGFGALLGWVRWREGGVKLRESVARPALRREDGRADRETGPPANHDG